MKRDYEITLASGSKTGCRKGAIFYQAALSEESEEEWRFLLGSVREPETLMEAKLMKAFMDKFTIQEDLNI